MRNIAHRQVFSYGTVYRWLFLWMPYIGILGGVAVLFWTALGGFPAIVSLAVVLWLVVITLALIAARPIFETLPTRIEVKDDRMVLWRHRRYRELSVSNILSIDTDVPSPYQWLLSGWIRLRYKQDSKVYQCYIGPYMNDYFDLVRFIDSRVTNCCTCGRNTFAWSLGMVSLLLTATAMILILCVVAVLTNWVAAGIALAIMAACLAWFALTYPSAIQLTDHAIHFRRVLGGSSEVRWSNVNAIGVGLGKSLSVGGFTISVRSGGKVWMPPLFAHLFELMICVLRQYDKLPIEGSQ